MLAGISCEYFLEVRTAYGQDDFVGLKQFPITCQCDIHQVTSIVQILKPAGNVVLEVLPAKLKFIIHCYFGALCVVFRPVGGVLQPARK